MLRFVVALLLVVTAGCGSSTDTPGGASETPPASASPQPTASPSSSPVVEIEACELVTDLDAGFVLGELSILPNPNPFDSPVLAGSENVIASACLYEPPGDEVRFVAIGVFTPEYMRDTFDADVQDATSLDVSGYSAWNKEGGVFGRYQYVGFLVVVATSPGGRDSAAGLYVADTAASRLPSILTPAPSPTPDANVAACELLSEDVAENAVGGADLSLTDGTATDEVRSQCSYEGEGYEVVLYLTEAPDGRADFEGIRQASKDGGGLKPISGLGDDAYQLSLSLYVLAEGAMLNPAVYGPGGDPDVNRTKDLARELVSALSAA